MKIGIISDTHDLLRQEVLDCLQGVDQILHAGDISSRTVLNRLGKIAPVRAVRGNADDSWGIDLPVFMDFDLEGLRVCMTHKVKDLPRNLSPYGLAVVGHTHQYSETRQGATILLNPGSCGPRRFIQPITMALAEIKEGSIEINRIDIAHAASKSLKTKTADLRQQIELVIRETTRGKTVAEVAAQTGIEPERVEQMVRLYVTHPGVTVDGIMTKMGL